MKINNLLSIPIYEFQCDDQLTEDILNQAKTVAYYANAQNQISATHFYHDKLFAWFDQCIKQVSDIYFLDEVSLPIISCWINKSSPLERHHIHHHTNSVLSGVFYLTDHRKSETVFYYENPYYAIGVNNLISASKDREKSFAEQSTTITGKITPQKGKLILFPSSFIHGTRPNTDAHTRYTVSFNTFFSGHIYENNDHRLNLTTDIILIPTAISDQNQNI
jgi:hypothetical protein